MNKSFGKLLYKFNYMKYMILRYVEFNVNLSELLFH